MRIGTAGWSIPGAAVPRFPGSGTHLERYARVLNCVEINSSFYRPHRRQTYERWAASTPRSFRFAVKLPKAITHEARLRAAEQPLRQFLAEVSGLGHRLGPLLVQLPPSFEFERLAVGNFFSLLRRLHGGAVVCEPRHASWFDGRADRLLLRHHVGRVAADPAPAPGAGQPGGWTDRTSAGGTVYFRLHGAPRKYWSNYGKADLGLWLAALMPHCKSSRVWCIFDNTAAGAATFNALSLAALAAQGGRAARKHAVAAVTSARPRSARGRSDVSRREPSGRRPPRRAGR
jgi:uncharacterized protein YecE (DUF72 family)